MPINGAVAAFEQFANAKRDRILNVFDGGQLVSFRQPGSASLGRQPTVVNRGTVEVGDVERHGGVDSRFHDSHRVRDGEARRTMVGTKIHIDGRRKGTAELVPWPVRSDLMIDAIRHGGAQPLGKVDDVAMSPLMGGTQPRPLAETGPRVVIRAPAGEVGNDADMVAHLGVDRERRKREPDARHRIALSHGVGAGLERTVRDEDLGPDLVVADNPQQAVFGKGVEPDHRTLLGPGFRTVGGDQSRLDHEGGVHVRRKRVHRAHEPSAARLLARDLRGLVIALSDLPASEVEREPLTRRGQEPRQLTIVFVGLDAQRPDARRMRR